MGRMTVADLSEQVSQLTQVVGALAEQVTASPASATPKASKGKAKRKAQPKAEVVRNLDPEQLIMGERTFEVAAVSKPYTDAEGKQHQAQYKEARVYALNESGRREKSLTRETLSAILEDGGAELMSAIDTVEKRAHIGAFAPAE